MRQIILLILFKRKHIFNFLEDVLSKWWYVWSYKYSNVIFEVSY